MVQQLKLFQQLQDSQTKQFQNTTKFQEQEVCKNNSKQMLITATPHQIQKMLKTSALKMKWVAITALVALVALDWENLNKNLKTLQLQDLDNQSKPRDL